MGSHRTNVPLRRKQNRPEAEEKDLETTDLLTGPAIAATAAKAQSLGDGSQVLVRGVPQVEWY